MSSPGPNNATASAVCWLERLRSCRAPSRAPETAPKSRPHATPPTPTNKAARITAASWAAWMPSAVMLLAVSPCFCVVLLLYQNCTRVAAISVAVFSLRLLSLLSVLHETFWQLGTAIAKTRASTLSSVLVR